MRVRYLALVVLVVSGGLTVAYRWAYGSLPWDGGPDRVQWCDRKYNRPAERERLDRDVQLGLIFRAPPLVGDRFYARGDVDCGSRTETLVYRSMGDGEYELYALSGGP